MVLVGDTAIVFGLEKRISASVDQGESSRSKAEIGSREKLSQVA